MKIEDAIERDKPLHIFVTGSLVPCSRCGKTGHHNCTKMAGQKSPHGSLLMIDHSAGWPYTDPNIPCDC